MFRDETRRAALSVNEFCATLGLGRTTFYSQVQAGRIRILKVGTRTLVPASEVDAFLSCMANGGQRD